MKNKSNEWVSIADLMAGVMAVVMLLLVLSVLQHTVAAKNDRKLQQASLAKILVELEKSVHRDGAEGIISVDANAGTITLQDSFFDLSSACVTQKKAIDEIERIGPSVTEFLREYPQGQVLVEGHTDSTPVKRTANDKGRYCAVYDDNLTLSAARAREVRKTMFGEGNPQNVDVRRVIVAGYGDSDPRFKQDPQNPRNRRVEIRFIIQEQVRQ